MILHQRTSWLGLIGSSIGKLKTFLSEDSHYVAFILGCTACITALSIFQGIRFFLLIYCLVFLLIFIRIKNAFVSLLLIYIFALQFVQPNKIYNVEVIRGAEILEKIYSEGYIISYFFNIATFLTLPLLVLMVRDFYLKNLVLGTKQKRVMLVLIFSWIGFSLLAFYSNHLSPYSFLSGLWLIQYCFMFCVAVGITYAASYPKFIKLLFSVIATMVCLQAVIGSAQFFLQGRVGLSYEGIQDVGFPTGLDENNATVRVAGTFMFHNQLAFCLAILLAFLLPFALKKRSNTLLYVVASGLLTIVLTQSRSTLLGVVFFSLLNYFRYQSTIISLVKKFGVKRLVIYIALAFILSSFALIPRILLTANTFFAGGGLAIRVKMTKEALEVMQASPLFGYGIGTNEYVLHKLFPNGVTAVFPAAVHLAFLQLILEVGVLGLSMFFLPFFFLLRTMVYHFKSRKLDEYKIGFIGGLMVLVCYWSLLPHVGIIEFGFLGIILGLGGVWYSSSDQGYLL